MKPGWVYLFFVFLLSTAPFAGAAVYYVDQNNPQASDTNAGGADRPFKTVQKGVNTAVAGDTVTVKAGLYPEVVETKAGGTSGARIVIQAAKSSVDAATLPAQRATVNGFKIYHPYVTVQGFDITGFPGTWDSHIRVDTSRGTRRLLRGF